MVPQRLLNPLFKELPKTYESVRTRPFNFKVVSKGLRTTYDGGFEEYVKLYRKTSRRINSELWRATIENTWLALNFVYRNQRRRHIMRNGAFIDKAWAFFTRTIVGYQLKTLTNNRWYYSIACFFKDLYPDMLDKDPFKDPDAFKFPFKHISMDHMALVYRDIA